MEQSQTKPAIHILTSEQQQEKMRIIQKKLQSEESQKARKLLAFAMTHFEAMKLVRGRLEEKELNGAYLDGHRLFKD